MGRWLILILSMRIRTCALHAEAVESCFAATAAGVLTIVLAVILQLTQKSHLTVSGFAMSA